MLSPGQKPELLVPDKTSRVDICYDTGKMDLSNSFPTVSNRLIGLHDDASAMYFPGLSRKIVWAYFYPAG